MRVFLPCQCGNHVANSVIDTIDRFGGWDMILQICMHVYYQYLSWTEGPNKRITDVVQEHSVTLPPINETAETGDITAHLVRNRHHCPSGEELTPLPI